ncbi:hypothetical protein [Streptomyces sp. CC224B]|uniref:hypothetical protein n=1 Tax=Streptomyces sp. CC224B TaxID=3044571 RepID=UPI0024A8AFAC|nr:hypothetical protein [Streptomyces sp. CC224B]
MDVAAAAATANVTADTIRTWCRRNVISAIKHAGRWIIDEPSLRHRLRIGRRLARKRAERLAPRRRARLLAALDLPALTGTPRQIAWAEDLRAARIEQALTVTRHGRGLAYHIGAALGVIYVPGLADGRDAGPHGIRCTTHNDALTVMNAALAHAPRTHAAWWIDRRHMTAPC